MQNRLMVWLAVATAFVAFVALVTIGLQPLALFGLVHVPAVLMLLLALRAVVCLARGEPTALRLGSREVLGGRLALVVPLLVLTVWTIGRERGTFSARLTATTMEDRADTTWNTLSNKSGPGQVDGIVSMPDEFAQATTLTIGGGDGVLHECFAAELRPMAQLLPGYRIRGRIELQSVPPFAALPLWKTAEATGHTYFELYLCATDSGDCRAKLSGTIDVGGSCTMWGFAAQRDFHAYLGARFGAMTRRPMIEQLRKLADSLR
jgi:hypothetical protein